MMHTLLREGTRAHHRRAEGRLPLLDPGLSRERYGSLLAALHAFHAPLEARLSARPGWPAPGLDWDARRKAHLLAADLRWLGGDVAPTVAWAGCADLPDVSLRSAALGAMYVVEGSTLGGQLVARHLAATLDLHPGAGASFFSAYGARTGAMWRAFLAALDDATKSGLCEPEGVLRGARDTFDALTRWLSAASGAQAAACAAGTWT